MVASAAAVRLEHCGVGLVGTRRAHEGTITNERSQTATAQASRKKPQRWAEAAI